MHTNRRALRARRAARTGAIVAVALAGSLLAGTTWASSQTPGAELKDRCVTTLGTKPITDPGTERKPRCPTAVRYVPRGEAERAAIARDEIAPRPVGHRA